jgi:hypothetical protein
LQLMAKLELQQCEPNGAHHDIPLASLALCMQARQAIAISNLPGNHKKDTKTLLLCILFLPKNKALLGEYRIQNRQAVSDFHLTCTHAYSTTHLYIIHSCAACGLLAALLSKLFATCRKAT